MAGVPRHPFFSIGVARIPMDDPLAIFPIWVVIIDYLLGVIMWTLIGRVAITLDWAPW